MSLRVVDRIDGWDERPFPGGYDGLRELESQEFSGVVRAGGVELYLTVGTIVGVEHGTVEDVADASGTARVAPHPALPLLAVMQEADTEVRAQYYTEETPISEVERTLSGGGFTGYVELSENVLSGDYFLAFHGGESMSVAYVGESEQLITDDEAFQTADDEVGIYKVRQVDIDPIEIPAGERAEGDTAAAATSADAGAEATTETTPDDGERADEDAASGATEAGAGSEASSGDDAVAAQDTGTASSAGSESTAAGGGESTADADHAGTPTEPSDPDEAGEAAGSASGASAAADQESTGGTDAPDSADATVGGGADARESTQASNGPDATTQASSSSGRATSQEPRAGGEAAPDETAGGSAASGGNTGGGTTGGGNAGGGNTGGTAGGGTAAGGGHNQSTGGSGQAGRDSGFGSTGGQAGDLETRAIPSLDPDQTKVPSRERRSSPGGAGQGVAGQGTTGQAAGSQPAPGQGAGGQVPSAETDTGAAGGQQPAQSGRPQDPPAETAGAAGEPDDGQGGDVPAGAEGDLAELEAEIDRLETELAETTEERDDLQEQLAAVREERDELQAEVDRLDTELRRLEDEFGAASDADQRMTPAEAMEGTNLFVDYDSKGDATLEKAHDGSGSREELFENLQVGVHTEFDQAAVAVGGQAFDEFLEGTLHYRFAEWVVSDLLFEIRDTGHAEALTDLYDAIPKIRRVEFNGTVDVEYVEDGQEKTSREQFDVIFRHRMGDALVVANLNDARDPATGGMMDNLVTAAERVGQTEDGLAAAFLVTSSFFESEALETVSEATRGGILSRDSRASFVNLSRKAGYHLCLTAARDGNFHMEVPEL